MTRNVPKTLAIQDTFHQDNTSIHHERVRAAFEGRKADRPAICEQAFASSVASKMLGRDVFTGSTDLHYAEARAWMAGEQSHDEFVLQLHADIKDLHRFFDYDIYFVPWRLIEKPTRQLDEYRFLYGDPDGDQWSILQFDPESRTFGKTTSGRPDPSGDEICAHIRAVLRAPPPHQNALRKFQLLEWALRDCADEFVVAGDACMMIPMQAGWLEATALEPELIADYLDWQLEGMLKDIQAQARAGIWLINGGGDFASNNGPIYSPRFFHNVMAPRWKRIFDACRRLGVYYIFRSDGNLWPVADDLFGRARPDAFYECDYDAGMRFPELRARFADLTLIGNVSCDLLRTGTALEVQRRAEECLRTAYPRVIISSSNAILHGTPPENVRALYDTAKKYVLK